MKPEREFWKGTYYLLILKSIKEGKRYGYQIKKGLEAFGNPSESTVYETLKKLEKGGYIKGRWITDGKRLKKEYEITEKGEELLERLLKEAETLCSYLIGQGRRSPSCK